MYLMLKFSETQISKAQNVQESHYDITKCIYDLEAQIAALLEHVQSNCSQWTALMTKSNTDLKDHHQKKQAQSFGYVLDQQKYRLK